MNSHSKSRQFKTKTNSLYRITVNYIHDHAMTKPFMHYNLILEKNYK